MKRRAARPHLLAATALTGALAACLPGAATAAPTATSETGALFSSASGTPPVTANAPVTFLADTVSYDKDTGVVTATGHVKAEQDGHTLYADEVQIYRTSNTAVATGHVVLVEPTGNTVFAHKATLTRGMKDAVLAGVASRLADNGKLVANGGKRYNGLIDRLARVVYSSCDVCAADPAAAPLWQIVATSATRDLQHKMIEYHNARLEIYGFPIFYTPFLAEPDPSVKRRSGLLIPSLGISSHAGFFIAPPYYLVINNSSDLTITPFISSKNGPMVDGKYRLAFNRGQLTVNGSIGQDRGTLGNALFANGVLDLNDTWRAGFSYNHASNPTYLDDFNILPNSAVLGSTLYLEGFGAGSYARVDTQTFQGLVASIDQSTLPIVLPHAEYDYYGATDSLGGHVNMSVDAFNIFRQLGTQDKRAAFQGGYTLPFQGPWGQLYTARVETIDAAWSAGDLNEQPNFSTVHDSDTSRAMAYGALFMRWPFASASVLPGNVVIQPEVQLVAAPVLGVSQNPRIPNEDSLDLQFSDANLFDFNRYPGIDRMDGGSRVDYALEGTWYMPHGAYVEGFAGQSYRFHKDSVYLPDSGLTDNISDIVVRATVAPSPLFSVTYRGRLSHDDLQAGMTDVSTNVGPKQLRFTAGYLYTSTNPYTLFNQPGIPAAYFTPRKELTLGVSSAFGAWNLGASVTRDLQTGSFDDNSATVGWQNDCFGIELDYYRRYTSFNLDHGDTTLLLQLNFKTLGNIGFNAL